MTRQILTFYLLSTPPAFVGKVWDIHQIFPLFDKRHGGAQCLALISSWLSADSWLWPDRCVHCPFSPILMWTTSFQYIFYITHDLVYVQIRYLERENAALSDALSWCQQFDSVVHSTWFLPFGLSTGKDIHWEILNDMRSLYISWLNTSVDVWYCLMLYCSLCK